MRAVGRETFTESTVTRSGKRAFTVTRSTSLDSYREDRGVLAWITATVITLSLQTPQPRRTSVHHHHRPTTPRAYARRLTLHRWHRISEWRALDAVVQPESGWDSCAVYPSRHDCGYEGSSSCGLAQRDPCPAAWRGRLYVERWAQVRDLIRYVSNRYGDPLGALAFHESHHWY